MTRGFIIYLFLALLYYSSCTNKQEKFAKISNKPDQKVNPIGSYQNENDTSQIKSPEIKSFLKSMEQFETGDIQAMNGIKLSFHIPSTWNEVPKENTDAAYHFYTTSTIGVELQVAVSPPSKDNDITPEVINKLRGMFPDITSERKLKVAGKNAYEMIHYRTKQLDGAISYLNLLSVVFFHKTQLIIFSFGSVKLNENESFKIVNDLKIFYRYIVSTIKLIN
jgi:hypothetical protein